MDQIESGVDLNQLTNPKNELLIIEHAFMDMKMLQKKEQVIKKMKEAENKKKEQKKIVEMLKSPNVPKAKATKSEKTAVDPKEEKLKKKIQKKQVEENRKAAARILVEHATEIKDPDAIEKAVESIKKVAGRGLRNRLKRKLKKAVGTEENEFAEIKKEMAMNRKDK